MVFELGKVLNILSKGTTQFDIAQKDHFSYYDENVCRLSGVGIGAGGGYKEIIVSSNYNSVIVNMVLNF